MELRSLNGISFALTMRLSMKSCHTDTTPPLPKPASVQPPAIALTRTHVFPSRGRSHAGARAPIPSPASGQQDYPSTARSQGGSSLPRSKTIPFQSVGSVDFVFDAMRLPSVCGANSAVGACLSGSICDSLELVFTCPPLSLSWSLAISGSEACGVCEAVEQSPRDFHLIPVKPGRFKTGAP